MPGEKIISPFEPVDIQGRQPTEVKKGPTKIDVGLSVDKKYVQFLMPDRLEPTEGLWLNGKEAIGLGRLLIKYGRMVIK